MKRKELAKFVQVLPTIKTKLLEWEGQPVLTFAQIDQLHQRPDGTSGAAFRRNRKRFVKGVDYFLLENQSVSVLRRHLDEEFKGGYATLILVSESGYLMLTKSFKDDLSWEVQRGLVNQYFKLKKLNQIEIQQQKVQDLKYQIFKLENDPLTLQGFTQLSLKDRKKQRSQIWEIWRKTHATLPALNYRRIQVARQVNLIINGMTSYRFRQLTGAGGLVRDWMPLANQYCFYLAEHDLLELLRQRRFDVDFQYIERVYPRLAQAARIRVESMYELTLSNQIEDEVNQVLQSVRDQIAANITPYIQTEAQILKHQVDLTYELERLEHLMNEARPILIQEAA